MNKLKVLDLFSGIGGFSLGLERTGGFETVAFCEVDKDCRKVLKKHWPEVPIIEDITNFDPLTVDMSNEIIFTQEIDVICGGFPCQDISVAGKQEGIDGSRSGLWKEYARIIKEIKPRFVIIENVANLRSKGLNKVLKDLWEIGYDAQWDIIPASSIGALHKRERIWIVAYPDSSKLREQPRGSIGENWESKVQSGEYGKPGTIRHSRIKRLDGHTGEERHVPINKKRDNSKAHSEGAQRKLISREDGQILSRRSIERIRSAYSEHWESVSRVHRVVNGLSKGMERDRKIRIRQLGNAVVPQIPQLIGEQILEKIKGME